MRVAIDVMPYGDFSLSKLAIEKIQPFFETHVCNLELEESFRSDPRVIKVIDEIGCEAASGSSCNIIIIEIPDDIDWYIEKKCVEWIAEKHRTWGKEERNEERQ